MEDPSPFRRLALDAEHAILLEGSNHSAEHPQRSFLFTDPVTWLEVWQLAELPSLFARLETARAEGLWAAGYLSYECGYHWEPSAAIDFTQDSSNLPLAAFGLYRAPQQFFSCVTSSGCGQGLDDPALGISFAAFEEKVNTIRSLIECGDTYQANLTDVVRDRFDGSPLDLFTHMMRTQPVAHGALLRVGASTILSASPELFFSTQGRRITVRPMKGTAPPGRNAEEDAALMLALQRDEKNRAENVMIADLMRNDLGRIAETGSVQVTRLFDVVRLPSLLQMSTEVTATLRPEITLYKLFASLFPPGSIVGAPKIRTMQILRALEARERGIYTGAIGFIAPDGESVFNVAIRTAVLTGDRFEMGVGAGITYDSTAADEYRECLLKASFLRCRDFCLIETMRCENGECTLLPLHLERLQASAAHFGFRWKATEVRAAIEDQANAAASLGPSRLRLELHPDGAIAFTAPEPLVPDLAPLTAMLWPEAVRSDDLFLRHKTTRRALYNKAFSQASAAGFADAIFHNEAGIITEGAISNLFIRRGERWSTPPLTAGVLPGVYRRFLLGTRPEIHEEAFTLKDLQTADEIYLTNAVRGMRRVSLHLGAPFVTVSPR
jgi:para-aminobenzoate synthetase/4-amino-4-deoxychorismate lyase